jgi:hypothetical protein
LAVNGELRMVSPYHQMPENHTSEESDCSIM